jgi:aminoglycoside phosphotransferase (APT) family kinase protein
VDNIDDAALAQALRQHGLGELLSFEPILRGHWRQNVALTATGGQYVFRGRPILPQQFQIEAQAVSFLARQHVVPVPAPYLVDDSHRLFPWDYALMPLLDGIPVEGSNLGPRVGPQTHAPLLHAAGDLLARLHELPVGPDDQQGFPLLAGEDAPLARLLARARHNLNTCQTRGFLTPLEAHGVLEKLEAGAAPSSLSELSFVHGDFQVNNLLVSAEDGARIVGLLDFSGSHFGHAAEDLPRLLCMALDLDASGALADAFMGAYRARRHPARLEALPFYLLCERLDLWVFIKDRRAEWVYQSLSFSEWVAPYLSAAERWGLDRSG